MKSLSLIEYTVMTAGNLGQAHNTHEEDILLSRETSFGGNGNLSCKAVEESLSAAVRRQKQKLWL